MLVFDSRQTSVMIEREIFGRSSKRLKLTGHGEGFNIHGRGA